MGRRVDLGLAERWRLRLVRFEAGRLGVAAFCRREGVSQAAFYQWRKKLGGAQCSDTQEFASDRTAGQAAGDRSRAAAAENGGPERSRFREIELVGAVGADPATIRLPGGVVFEIAGDRSLVESLFVHALRSSVPLVSGAVGSPGTIREGSGC